MSQDTRRLLHSSFTFVRSVESNKAAAAITLDHMIGEQIAFLKGGEKREILDPKGESAGSRTSRFDELEELDTNLKKMVDSIKKAGSDEAKLAELGISNEDFEEGV
jgi:hypothetical protein